MQRSTTFDYICAPKYLEAPLRNGDQASPNASHLLRNLHNDVSPAVVDTYPRQHSTTMPTTRRQMDIAEGKIKPEQVKAKKKRSRSSTQRKVEKHRVDIAENDVKEDTQQGNKLDDQANHELKEKQLDGEDMPASKKLKMEETEETKSVYKVGEDRNMY